MGMITRFLRSRDFLLFLILILAGYLLVERAGLFGIEPAPLRGVFHSLPVRIISIAVGLNALFNLLFVIRERILRKAGYILFFLSLLFFVSGLWLSYYTRFEGRVVRAEGETFEGFLTQYDMASLYTPKLKKSGRLLIPQVGITVLGIEPFTSSNPDKLKRVEAKILYSSRTTKRVLQGRLNSVWPLISDWTMITITDFGYAPRYLLSDLQGNKLESEQLYMRLYPSGREASFEAMFLGYTFYIRCYPDYIEREGRAETVSAIPKNPVFNLRITRNKDIVYNGLIKPTERLRFDNIVISLSDVKMWVEISLVRDFGLPVVALGCLLLIASLVFMAMKRK